MSDKQFEPLDGYDYVHEGPRAEGQLTSWIRLFIQFCIVAVILWVLVFGYFPFWRGAPRGIPWPLMMIAFWILMLLMRGSRNYHGTHRKSGEWIERRDSDIDTDLDDLFEVTAYEKSKRVARLGDDGEIVYVEESQRSQHESEQ